MPYSPNQSRERHHQEVVAFLQKHFSKQNWQLTLPASGRGHETYLAQNRDTFYFVKIGAQIPYYQILAEQGVTPPVIAVGSLADGTSILVQSYVKGRNPSWQDFRDCLVPIANLIQRTHQCETLQKALLAKPSSTYQDAGIHELTRVQQKWALYRSQLPIVADEVDTALTTLQREIETFTGQGFIASHNDICNGNWLINYEGKVYLVDLETMSLDDPAQDMGALLWWYYPVECRQRFLDIAGYTYNEVFKNRMRVRMALHCLDILLPRTKSFDRFNATSFVQGLEDFRAVMDGKENPHGYVD